VNTDAILAQTSHRPWPLPGGPWIIQQSWRELLFAHWPLDLETVRARVPEALELDSFDGRAWVSIAAFRIDPFRTRALPIELSFPELNLRTYVRKNGRPGVYFFSLDADSRTAVVGARTLFRLNYYDAAIAFVADTHFDFTSRRLDRPRANFHARYRGVGPPTVPGTGSLEEWLVERYCLYAARSGGSTFRVEIHHGPWVLQPAEAEISPDELFFAAQLRAPNSPPLLHYSERLDVLTWGPETATATAKE
jgi:uncharacterized protein YqjF (DUF2071 family)